MVRGYLENETLNPVTWRADIYGMTSIVAARAWIAPLLLALVAAAAVAPAHATDLDSLRAEVQSIADEARALERRLGPLERREAALNAEVAELSGDIGELELELRDVDRAHDEALQKYVDWAVATYKSGGDTARLGLLLSARTVTDLETLAGAAAAVAKHDARALEGLQDARATAQRAHAALDARRQRLIAAQSETREVSDALRATLAERRAKLDRLTAKVERLEAEARARLALAAPTGDFLDRLRPTGPSQGIPEGFTGTGVRLSGIASWYGPGFEGNPTANGDIFDPDLFTAAHKELPLGTWLYVEHEGRGVVVLVNDRGPYIDGRILDLSRAAAFSIGITGIGWVDAEIITKD